MKLLYWTGWLLSRMIGRLIFRMKIFEANNIPDKGPFILACNHISLVDPPLVGSTIGRALHFMAKKELFRNRLFGWVIRNTNAHPVNRRGFDRNAINTASEILKAGCGLLVFPEGTRALKGDFLPPRPGIGLIAIQSKAPVVPAYFNGSNNLKAVFWGRDRLGIIFGKPIEKDEIGTYDDDRNGYRKLAEDIMGRIKDLKDDFTNKAKTD